MLRGSICASSLRPTKATMCVDVRKEGVGEEDAEKGRLMGIKEEVERLVTGSDVDRGRWDRPMWVWRLVSAEG